MSSSSAPLPSPTCVNNFFASLSSGGQIHPEKEGLSIGTLAGAIAGSASSLGIQLLIFLLLRLRLSRIYRPKSYLVPERERVPPPPRGLYQWLTPVFTTSNLAFIQKSGLDAYFFLRFLRTLLKFFLPISVIALPILLPLNRYSGGNTEGLDLLTMGNVAPKYTRSRLWAHLIIAVGIVIWFCYVVYHELRGYIRVRQAYLTSPQHRIRASATTVLVTGIPRKWLTLEALSGLYDVFPGGIKNIWINRNFSKLAEKVKQRDNLALDLEDAETRLIKLCRTKHAKKEMAEAKKSGTGKIKEDQKHRDAREDADAEKMAQGHGLSAGERSSRPNEGLDMLHPNQDENEDQLHATNTRDSERRRRRNPFGVVGHGFGAVGHGIGTIGKGVGTVGQRVAGDLDASLLKAGDKLNHTADEANAGMGFATNDELYGPPISPEVDPVASRRADSSNSDLESHRPDSGNGREGSMTIASHPFAAASSMPGEQVSQETPEGPRPESSGTHNHSSSAAIKPKSAFEIQEPPHQRGSSRLWRFWRNNDDTLRLPSPQPHYTEEDEFPLRSPHPHKLSSGSRELSRESICSGANEKPSDSQHRGIEYPPAYDADWDEDQGDQPRWRMYINPKDRETLRLPLISQGWFPRLPFVGAKVDRIYWLRRELARLNLEIERDQHNVQQYPYMTSAFIQFNHQIAAHMACQSVSHHIPQFMAPRLVEISPDDVLWENMAVKWWERHLRTVVVLIICVGLIILFIPLVTFTSLLSNVGQLGSTYCWLSWLQGLVDQKVGLALVQGILPAALLSLIMLIVPIIFRLMIKQQGVATGNDQELGVQNWYFAFLFIVIFLIVTLSKGLTSFLAKVASNPVDIASNLAENLPKAVNYFYSYLLVQSLSNSAGALLQVFTLIQWFILAPMNDSTPRAKWKRQTLLSSVEWGSFFPPFTNFAVIGIVYSAIAPLILVFMLIIYSVFWVVYRYNVLYVYRFRHDTGGLLFPTAINQLFTGIYVLELCLIGLFFLARDENDNVSCIPQAVIMIVVFAFTVLYHWQLNKTFNPLYRYLPITLEDEAVIRDEEFARAQASKFAPLRGNEAATEGDVKHERDAEDRPGQEMNTAQPHIPEGEKQSEQEGDAHTSSSGGPSDPEIPTRSESTKKPEGWRGMAPNAVTRLRQAGGMRKQTATVTPDKRDVEAQHTVGDILYSGFAEDLEDLSPQERDMLVRYSFQHSALRARRPVVWIPRDRLGVSDDEIQRTKKMSTVLVEDQNGGNTQMTNIWMSNEGTALDSKGRAVFRRSPPDFSNVDLIAL